MPLQKDVKGKGGTFFVSFEIAAAYVKITCEKLLIYSSFKALKRFVSLV